MSEVVVGIWVFAVCVCIHIGLIQSMKKRMTDRYRPHINYLTTSRDLWRDRYVEEKKRFMRLEHEMRMNELKK